MMFSTAVGMPGTFQGMFAFQHRQASDKCCKIVLDLFCFNPSGIMSGVEMRQPSYQLE
jgi:hypothetical protein